MKINELSGGDIVRRGSSHDTFIGMGLSPLPYSVKSQVIWILEDGDVSIEEIDWDTDVGFMSSYRNSNLDRLLGVFGDCNVHTH